MTRPHLKTTRYDSAYHLKSKKDIAAYIDAALRTDDRAIIRQAITTVSRALGVKKIARDSGIGRERLFRVLASDEKREVNTLIKVARTLRALHSRVE